MSQKAVEKALSFLEDCTLNEECLEAHFSDILSAWWNIGTFPRRRKYALSMMRSEGIINGLKHDLKDLSKCVNKGNSQCSISLVLTLFNAKRYGLQVPLGAPAPSTADSTDYEVNYRVLEKAVVRGLKEMAPWHDQGIYEDIPSGSMDFLLVITWAAKRIGLRLGPAWEHERILGLVKHLRPYRLPSTGMGANEYMMSKSNTMMVLHIVYVTGEFGLTRVSTKSLEGEFNYLFQTLEVATHFNDFELVGEILDALDVAGVKENPLEGGRAPSPNLLEQSKSVLLNSQNADGTWGDQFDMHTHYVSILGLMKRDLAGVSPQAVRNERPVATFNFGEGGGLSNEAYWDYANSILSDSDTDAAVSSHSFPFLLVVFVVALFSIVGYKKGKFCVKDSSKRRIS